MQSMQSDDIYFDHTSSTPFISRLNRNPNHKPACKGGMLVCRLHVPPKDGVKDVYGRIRPRVKQDFKGEYALCQQFATGIPCKVPYQT